MDQPVPEAVETVPTSRWRIITGSVVWILSIQYFVVEYIARLAWGPTPYTLRFNTISDLGATSCGTLPTIACSSLHPLMNASFMLSSAITLSGMYFMRTAFPKHSAVKIGMVSIAIGSLGAIVVGLFPENENIIPHFVGALTYFVLSNLGLVILGVSLYRKKWHPRFALMTAAFGLVGLVALLLLPLTFSPFGGVGLVERLVAYPVTIWLIATGIFGFAKLMI